VRFLPYSDFIFSGLWAWDTDERCAIAMLGHNLVFRLKDYTSADYFYTFLGQDDVVEASSTLLAHARQEGLLPLLKLIPDEVIAAEKRLERWFSIDTDRDNFDYLYAVNDWACFPAPQFAEHQAKARRCRANAALDFQFLDPGDAGCQESMNELFRLWARQKQMRGALDTRHEWAAMQRLFSLSGNGGIAAGGSFDGDRLVGFAIWEGLPSGECVVGHFQKTDRGYRGLSSWQAQMMAQRLAAEGHRVINGEQDLGIPGLRAHKLSLQPCEMLRKYVIAERDAAGSRGR
jgi:hypothetical protein